MLKTALTVGALLGATALIATEMSKPKHQNNSSSPSSSSTTTPPSRTGRRQKRKGKNVKAMVFKANWCAACKQFTPLVEEYKSKAPGLSNDTRDVSVEVFEVDNNRNLASEYKIQSLPTVVYVVDGKEVSRQVGRHDILAELTNL